MKRAIVTRVTIIEFELNDRRIYQHPPELSGVPINRGFQRIYDHWRELFEREPDDRQESGQDLNAATPKIRDLTIRRVLPEPERKALALNACREDIRLTVVPSAASMKRKPIAGSHGRFW